ncbi:MAG: hypothetical protein K0S32_3453 [Bacteroidetes bacterium]|jgi:hypothetical protein|nr:hypothetical protein [Bacteroidota bacterium]
MKATNNNLLNVGFRQQAIFIPTALMTAERKTIAETTAVLVANLSKLGFGVSEQLLNALNRVSPAYQLTILETAKTIVGVNKNWTPLVKGWDTPTGETVVDHIMTFFANVFQAKGTKLQCGHIIPAGTFPLERYNGCPFCGTPFEFGKIENYNQGSKLKILELWTEKEAAEFMKDLLESKTALDATQIDSLKLLMKELSLPDVKIGMKETAMTVIDIFCEQNQPEKAQTMFSSPADVLRYLWYKHTGFLQVIEPKTIAKRNMKNSRHITRPLDKSATAKLNAVSELKLKYGRKESLRVATWINNIDMETSKMCEIMHPKRNMWVRFIRALRLPEYSKREGFEKLKDLLDKFYKEEYTVWQGQVNHFRLRADAENTLNLLKQRPGMFARSLFANMLWFGAEDTVSAFSEVVDKVPARLVFTLNMYAQNYFDKTNRRVVKPLGGVAKNVPSNALLGLYEDKQLDSMKDSIAELCLLAMKKRFASIENRNKTIYIDPMLFKIPVSIGDRSDSVQDLPSALMGTRFPIEGDVVRLFMQWGNGLPAQHMDMDLSCHIAYDKTVEYCSFHSLNPTGCKHSGDIRSIPDKIGTAEYIEIDVAKLKNVGARYVTFTCNAYSNGSITPNMVIGWMNSKHPMRISETSGVAYDPSCVQHQVRVVNSLAKGLVFGVLEVETAEIIWLEMPFGGQLVRGLDVRNVEAMLKKLDSKLNVGHLLTLKAEAQNLQVTDNEQADEVYTRKWAMNTAAVTKLLVD